MSENAAPSEVDKIGNSGSIDSDDFGNASPFSSDREDEDIAYPTLRFEEYVPGSPCQRPLGKLHPGQPRKPRIIKPQPPPRQIAKVENLAELPTEAATAANPNIDTHILERIRKCLDRANHPNTPEMESQAAMRMSSRIMTQYNISTADVLAQASTSEEQAQLGGESTVVITSTKSPSTRVVSQTWVSDVAIAMTVFFDCKCYSTAWNYKIVWTFYGILPNTVAAAMSFEMAHNLILEWARKRKGVINSYCLGVAAGLLEMAREEKKAEERLAKQQEREAINAKIEQERINRQKELDRLHGLGDSTKTGKASLAANVEEDTVSSRPLECARALSNEDSSDEDAFSPAAPIFGEFDADEPDETESKPTFNLENEVALDPCADFEEELQKIIKHERSTTPLLEELQKTIKRERSPTPPLAHVQEENEPTYDRTEQEMNTNIKCVDLDDKRLNVKDERTEDSQTEGLSLWKSSRQVALFRKSAMNVAEEYLKAGKTKLKKGKKRKYSVRDRGAYEAGKVDSRNIDVRRRRIDKNGVE